MGGGRKLWLLIHCPFVKFTLLSHLLGIQSLEHAPCPFCLLCFLQTPGRHCLLECAPCQVVSR